MLCREDDARLDLGRARRTGDMRAFLRGLQEGDDDGFDAPSVDD